MDNNKPIAAQVLRVVSLIAVVISTIACVSATAIPSGQLVGTYEEIGLSGPCEDAFGISLRTDLSNKEPLFSLRSGLSRRECAWSISTVRNGQLLTVAPVPQDLFGTAFTPARDGAYWFISNGKYVQLLPTGQETFSQPQNPGFAPVAVAAAGNGRLFSIEGRGPRDDQHLRLVDLDRSTSTPIPLTGWVDNSGGSRL